jgi:peptidoglycan/xylan/chitin deacetylase (PgdA/CDA1 family)
MDRQFIGYANDPPIFRWPHGTKIAVNFVINYEEGSERNILDGDEAAENIFVDIPNVQVIPGTRHYSIESIFEYGSRVGIWRLLNLFDHYAIPTTIFAVGFALQRNPSLCEYLRHSSHEIAGHGYRWIDYRNIDSNREKIDITKTIALINELTGKSVYGWYTGRCSDHTRALLAETNIEYDSQSYADDLPYWIDNAGKPLLIIPYGLETNDIRYCTAPGWGNAEDAFLHLKYAFDNLYREGEIHPKILSIGLHPRLSGRPARAEALRKFISYIIDKSVWFCTRQDIATFWRKQFPYRSE